MKCLRCDYESFDLLETCKRCGAPMAATALAPIGFADDLRGLSLEPQRFPAGQTVPGPGRRGTARPVGDLDFVEMLDDDAIEVGENELDQAGGGPGVFRIDDDLFAEDTVGVTAWPGTELPGPAFSLSGEDHGAEEDGAPIIDREEEIPARYWAPEVAGVGRRALALLVDQSFLMVVLAVFFLGAFLALRLGGYDTDLFLAADGLQASALPFALLALLLSLVYFGLFHGSTGRTPGKALFGIEVRSGDGGDPTWDKVALRCFGAALGLTCAGVGIFWAIFEPRRRGWADMISGTVIARRR